MGVMEAPKQGSDDTSEEKAFLASKAKIWLS